MLKNTYINDKNKEINVYEYESISEYNEKMNTNHAYEEHEISKWNKADILKLAKDSVIGLIAITLLTMLVAAFRFAFVAKVETKYVLGYTLEYPKLVIGWILLAWLLWILVHIVYVIIKDRKVYFEYYTVDQMKALQRRNKQNRSDAYAGMTEDATSERYRSIRVIGYIEIGKKFNEKSDTDILEFPTDIENEDGERIVERYNIFRGQAKGKTVGYVKVSEDEYVRIIEHHLYPFVISGIATASLVCIFVTADIRPVKVNTVTGEVEVSDNVDKLQRKQEEQEAETLYLWIPAFSSKLSIDNDNQTVPLRNYSENQFRDVMWGKADGLREEIAQNPDAYDREELRKKFSITYLTLTSTEIDNCIRYVYGETEEKLRETYENEFSFRYDILVSKETLNKMDSTDEVPENILSEYRNSEYGVVYSTYPELLPPGTQDNWNAFEAFKESGEYEVKLRVIPYLTETLEPGSPRDVVVTVVVNK